MRTPTDRHKATGRRSLKGWLKGPRRLLLLRLDGGGGDSAGEPLLN